RQVADDHRAGPHDAQLADGHARSDKNVCAQPSIFSNHDRPGDQRHAPAHKIMGPGAKMAVLAEIGAIGEGDGRQIVEQDMWTDHRPRSECEFFRKKNPGGGKNHHLAGLGNAGAKQPEQPGAKSMARPGTPTKERRLHQRPDSARQQFTLGVGCHATLTEIRLFGAGHGSGRNDDRDRRRCNAEAQASAAVRPVKSASRPSAKEEKSNRALARRAAPASRIRRSRSMSNCSRAAARHAGASPAAWLNTKPFSPSATKSVKQASRDTIGTAPAAMASATATPKVSPCSARLG